MLLYKAPLKGIWFRFEQVLGVLDFYIFGGFWWFLVGCLWVVCKSLEVLEVVLEVLEVGLYPALISNSSHSNLSHF